MKARSIERRPGTDRSRASVAKPRTGDLFAPPRAEPALRTSPRSDAPPAARARPRQLWYAVVFPNLAAAAPLAVRESQSTEAILLQRLCMHAQQFTSFVSIEPPNALLLEVKGSLKLFGSAEALHARIDACWQRLELAASSATAPSTLAALWLARGKGTSQPILIEDPGLLAGCLAALPIACTAWDEERLRTLRAMGVMRLGELSRLPRAGLARRLGPEAVRDLDIALLRQFAPRRAFVPRERFRARCDFETEVEHAAYLEKAAEPLIARCAAFLRERQAGVQGLHLKLGHRRGSATEVRLGLASVTGERRRLMDVLVQKLTRLELRAPVRRLELISGSLRPLSADSLDVFAGSKHGGRDTAPQLVERLRARLGQNAVYGVMPIPEHRPEAAWRRVHELDPTRAPQAAALGLPRPVWLLEEPQPLTGGLLLEEGPERIESGWWDGRGVARDYYVARQAPLRVRTDELGPHPPDDARAGGGAAPCGGAKLWVFQERRSKNWYLHGVFA
jgi:protein ImuB